MVERQKTKAMAAKYHKNRRGISLSSRKEENYKSDIKHNINAEQVKDKYPQQL